MKAAPQKVVSIEYTLKDDDGDVLDSSEGDEPLTYLHGAENIFPGLERALEGKEAGNVVSVIVEPADGYGERNEALVSTLPSTQFPDGKLEVGQVFHAQTDLGHMAIHVVKVEDDQVTADGNHPLAGVRLHFEVKILEVRDATAVELTHGHVHGPGGHHH